jgi:hypothetical protein
MYSKKISIKRDKYMLLDLNKKLSFTTAIIGVVILISVLAVLLTRLEDKIIFYVGVPGILIGLALFVTGVYFNRTNSDEY